MADYSVNSLSQLDVVGPISRGAQAYVYRVIHRKLKTPMVINKKSQNYSKLFKRFIREIKIHQTLDHQNILKMYSSFQDVDNHYLLLEYCADGEITGKSCSYSMLQSFAYQLCQGLNYLHSKGIVHRDIKPSVVKISDFGLSGEQEEQGELCGTPQYMAPQLLLKQEGGKSVDVWSMGLVLYELATGNHPFRHNTIQKIFQLVKTKKLNYPQELNTDLRDFLQKCLQRNKNRRFSIQQLLQHQFLQQPHIITARVRNCNSLNQIQTQRQLLNHVHSRNHLSSSQSDQFCKFEQLFKIKQFNIKLSLPECELHIFKYTYKIIRNEQTIIFGKDYCEREKSGKRKVYRGRQLQKMCVKYNNLISWLVNICKYMIK